MILSDGSLVNRLWDVFSYLPVALSNDGVCVGSDHVSSWVCEGYKSFFL